MLEIRHLNISINNSPIVKDISFRTENGTITAIVGESGSGKTMTALSIMNLLPNGGEATGEIMLDEENLLVHKDEHYNISMIFQEPMTSLNPLMKVGRQVEEVLLLHTDMDKNQRKKRVLDMFKKVELPKPKNIYDKYPHELSGGMRQRVMIAMAMINNPKVLIADEPTTALDPVVQTQIMELLRKLNRTEHTTMIFISHDLNLVRNLANNIIVMNQGEIVEQGTPEKIFNFPEKEYTQKLINALPTGKKSSLLREEDDVLVNIRNVSLFYKEKHKIRTVAEQIDINVCRGEILGLIGKSGCGKTSLAKAILGLNKNYKGEIINKATDSTMIFQDPLSSLNPARKIKWILEEPLKVKRQYSSEERKRRVSGMLYRVGLTEEYLERYPSQLSGGQRQRVAIAAALIGGAEFVVADEAVSALDVTVQAQVLDLLLSLQKEFGLTILFISHDLRVVEKICDRIVEI